MGGPRRDRDTENLTGYVIAPTADGATARCGVGRQPDVGEGPAPPWLYQPVRPPAQHSARRPPLTAPSSPPTRVLVVDDDARVRAAVAALFATAPEIRVVGLCSSAAEALVAAQATRPDIVLLDLLLPEAEDGLTVLRQLHTGGVRVVAMSVRACLRQQALAAGAAAFLEKGVLPEVVIDTIRTAAG